MQTTNRGRDRSGRVLLWLGLAFGLTLLAPVAALAHDDYDHDRDGGAYAAREGRAGPDWEWEPSADAAFQDEATDGGSVYDWAGVPDDSAAGTDPAAVTDTVVSDGGDVTAVGGATAEDAIVAIIYEAADRYGQPREYMLRVAMCESNLDSSTVGAFGELGIFQFMPSTWETTPYADMDPTDPWAAANATGWMWSVGRRGEWVCQ